uniref:Uncharacterized protein n=1 Tax=Kwoniella pini CBS 10737 TaxID=1296096 RepID=A0A1B9HTM9_9TREE|nr:uncharacterized protein I206_07472 [Kwoniella pini CBS 10737]OCF46619.1 hypothetical protein I206_07472 [Kwoniella pini CBS 10737]
MSDENPERYFLVLPQVTPPPSTAPETTPTAHQAKLFKRAGMRVFQTELQAEWTRRGFEEATVNSCQAHYAQHKNFTPGQLLDWTLQLKKILQLKFQLPSSTSDTHSDDAHAFHASNVIRIGSLGVFVIDSGACYHMVGAKNNSTVGVTASHSQKPLIEGVKNSK